MISSDWRIELLDPALGCLRAGGYLESLILIILNIESQDVVMSIGVKAFYKNINDLPWARSQLVARVHFHCLPSSAPPV